MSSAPTKLLPMTDTADRAATRGLRVAIDGPSGSGKSSVSKKVASHLGIGYLDTGAMYRALTWYCLDQGIDLADVDAVAAAVTTMPLEMGSDPKAPTVSMGGRRIDADIRTTRIAEAVSTVATNLAVRPKLQQRQRDLMAEIAERTGGVVAEGRDVTTVVAPDADVRLLMVASQAARLARRSKELHGGADDAALARTRTQIVDRDQADSTVSQFMTAADGVVTLDTSDLTFDQSVEAVLTLIDRKSVV